MIRNLFAPIVLGLVAVLLLSSVEARELVVAPPGGGPGISVYEPDQQPPVKPSRYIQRPDPLPAPVTMGQLAFGDILGGDDVLVGTENVATHDSMDIASNGDIFLAVRYSHTTDGNAIKVFRSSDGGTTWIDWGTISIPGATVECWDPKLTIAEGNVDRCFIAYTRRDTGGNDSIIVAWEDLSEPVADFADQVTAIADAGVSFKTPDIATDALSFNSFYLYLVAAGDDGNGDDIWFARSTTQGTTWGASYKIGSLNTLDGGYGYPSVSYGFDEHVHCAWDLQSTLGTFDSAIRYRRAENDAGGGLSDWTSTFGVTSTSDGIYDERPDIVASHNGHDIVLAYSQFTFSPFVLLPPVAKTATDLGTAGFSASPAISLSANGAYVQKLIRAPVSGDWFVRFAGTGIQIITADTAAPSTWTEHGRFIHERDHTGTPLYSGSFAVDPTRNEQLAIGGALPVTAGYEVVFDAEWRTDEGYPVQEDGFPVALPSAPRSDPGLADLNGDGSLEIIFGDVAGNVWAVQSDGTNLPGWPVNVGAMSDSPIAVGQLTLAGEMYVVVGLADGRVTALGSDGSTYPGWPYDTGTGAPAQVSIAAFGGPVMRLVMVAAGDRMNFIDYTGSQPPEAPGWILYTGDARHACAAGDIDGDGITEVVWANGNTVFAVKYNTIDLIFSRTFSADISDAITLGDVDLDGDLEIAVPTADGTMYLLDNTGADMTGWPFSYGTAEMRSAAWANLLGTSEPELAIANLNWTVHLLYGTGVVQSGYPVQTGTGWYLLGSPIIAGVEGFSSDVLVGARDQSAWSWNNFGSPNGGWPRLLEQRTNLTPAVGDIDLDGWNEVVVLTTSNLQVFDIKHAPQTPTSAWPMSGHDMQRTGCSDCVEDVTTAVNEPTAPGVTRVSFAAPHPNPSAGHSVFSFEVPLRAVVSLEVLDVRGRRVRTIERSEMTAGAYTLGWDGRDNNTRSVADGIYYARLRVQGPGVNETLMRKVTLIR